ncbi:cbb3-type cytochrome oxidase assembly protein [Paucidesulfovibrio longus]|uniref:cbb3-type cytochrome oxidase assembly protein n=1 Tax=Paucidesulfovibrio longus TaxID=889 RepID=UPI00138AC8AE|nr:cbb3-type cytochrome oxidase assembly protein [Paucidesulfovibrio longus]
MPEGMWVLLGFSAFVISVGLVLLGWGLRSGQFRNVEQAKFEMLDDRDPAPWPTNEPGGHRD